MHQNIAIHLEVFKWALKSLGQQSALLALALGNIESTSFYIVFSTLCLRLALAAPKWPQRQAMISRN